MEKLARCILALAISSGLAACSPRTRAPEPESTSESVEKIAVTSASAEAVELYLAGRDLAEKLRGPDARKLYREAAALDESFALVHLGLATTSPTAQEFFDSLAHAVVASDATSSGERWMILAQQAAANGDPDTQSDFLTKLAERFPGDERAHNLLANFHFGRQEYAEAIHHYRQAIDINPDFSPPYNSLGYSQRALGKFDEAEQAFEKYIELLPDEPNPYDSYAELLMKTGRYEESIENYARALERDPSFIASYIGIGNNHMFMGRWEQARAAFDQLREVARNDGQRRQAHFWQAVSYLHQGDYGQALAELEQRYEIAVATDDKPTLSGDLTQIGSVLLEKGDAAAAATKFLQAVTTIDAAEVSDDVKDGARRNHLFFEARVALADGDLDSAEAKIGEYRRQVEARDIPFEVRQVHELVGMLALHRGDYDSAVTELEAANQQDPRILYLLALAYQGKGDQAGFEEFASRTAGFNQLNLNLAYVKGKAERLLQHG